MTRFQQLMALREHFEKRPEVHDDAIFGVVFGGASVVLALVIVVLLWRA